MRSLREFIDRRGEKSQEIILDDKTVFFLFRKIIREEYGMRGEAELIPTIFFDGILSVWAKSPLYSSELWMRREAIMSRMNVVLEREGVKEIRLVRYAP